MLKCNSILLTLLLRLLSFFKNIKTRYSDVATDEVSHLFAAADNDHDDRLSIDEIVDNHDLFVGSEATDYGDHLQNINNLRDEL